MGCLSFERGDMKKIIITVITVMILTAVTAGFAEAKEKARYGIKVGINFANLSGDFEEEFWESEARKAPVVGGYAVIKLTDFLFVQPEILLSYKGAKTADERYTDEISLSYVDIPVFLKASIRAHKSISPNIFCGPAVNLLTASEYQAGKVNVEIEDETMNFDVSAIFGAGVDIASGKGAFIFEGRYTIGFVSIDDRREPKDMRNRVFTIMGGYTF